MMKTTYKPILFSLLLLTPIYLLSWYLQSTLLMGWDPSWGLHETKIMLNGGLEGKDYFEATPPGFLYLYAGPVIIAAHTTFPLTLIFECYLFLLATVSLLFCNILMRQLFLNTQYFLRNFLMVTIAIIFLILPLPYDFGNREHLLLIFSFPYFLLVGMRLQGQPCSKTLAILIGLFGALGFLIKPFFLISLLGVELYYFCHKKTFFSWIRPETIIVISLLLGYIIILFTQFPTYFSITLPLSKELYYVGYKEPWYILLNQGILFFCFAVITLYFTGVSLAHKKLAGTLLITLVCFLVSYFLQRTSFYYHLLPAYSIALLLLILLIQPLFENFSATKNNLGFLAAFLIVIFSYPIYLVSERYQEGLIYKQKILPLITFLHNHAQNQPVMFFSTMITYEFPAVDYATALPASQYGVFSWVVGILKHSNYKSSTFQKEKNYFIANIANELTINKPKLILIDVQRYKPHLENLSFEYLAYFSNNPSFQHAWKNYHYVTTIEDKTFYKFDVYERSNT